MQAVPSLVGTGTAVAAAATGLVLGQLSDTQTVRPGSPNKRKLTSDYENMPRPSMQSRPGTSAAAPNGSANEDFPYSSFRQFAESRPGPLSSHPTAQYARPPRPAGTQSTPPKAANRRHSFIRQIDLSNRPIAENARDLISSRDSWIRRLSIRPLSQHGSPHSSMGPDSPKFSFSQGSGAPILSPAGSHGTPPTQPNKLVKRGTTGENGNAVGTLTRRGSRSQVPSFRRPATSHQRSATLQQFTVDGGFTAPPPSDAKESLDYRTLPRDFAAGARIRPSVDVRRESESWTAFFRSEIAKSTSRKPSRFGEGSANGNSAPSKRIFLRVGFMPAAYLTKASSLQAPRQPLEYSPEPEPRPEAEETEGSPKSNSEKTEDSPESTPSKRARRSISMHFSSPSTWISRTGSLRRPKRISTESNRGGKRHASDPVKPSQTGNVDHLEAKPAAQEIFVAVESRNLDAEGTASSQPVARKRNSSSPLPPLTRLSSFNLDVARIGLSSASSSRPSQPNSPLFASNMPNVSQIRTFGVDRTSTFASSDLEARDAASLEDEETDQSETVFDSFRTMASSSRVRAVDTPLDSMFDESPPSTAGNNSKTKRLSIQEILGRGWDGDTKIMEEEESLSTPMRSTHLIESVEFSADKDAGNDPGYDSEVSPTTELPFGERDFGRLSLDDEDDYDWNKDEENGVSNHLSPPSSSVNSRGVSPTLRHALASISGNGSPNSRIRDINAERPRSNIFDWCEPPAHERQDAGGHSPRPKTVHGKQELDIRGGRPANRKGPTAAHVRSQSVPVVPENGETSNKSAPKFGTWGLGTKTASEDWDDDFEFEEANNQPEGGKDSATSFSMVVPASIQARQPTVRAHAGQIRELSLLVNDLKRLCRHGKDLDILHGSAGTKWKEAEDIIALASPDEDDDVDSTTNGDDDSFDRCMLEDRFLDEGFDGSVLEQIQMQEPLDLDTEVGKTAVVRERQVVRRRSVFSPEDDIFGGGWAADESKKSERPRTPEPKYYNRNSAVISTVIEAMQQQQQRACSTPRRDRSPRKPYNSKLFFDTNSLQELVKRAGQLRDSLSDMVRRAELLTQSPAGTPRRERHARHNPDGSPAFTRVFSDPNASPPKRLPKSHSNNSGLTRTSIDSPRMQLMTVN